MIPTVYALTSHGTAIARGLSSLTPSSLFQTPQQNFWNLIRFGCLLHAKLNSLGQDWSTSRQIQNRSLRCYENLIQKFQLPTSKGVQNIQVSPGEGSFKDPCFGLRHSFPKFHLNAFLVCPLSFLDHFCSFTVLSMKHRTPKFFSALTVGPFKKDRKKEMHETAFHCSSPWNWTNL